jgi:hypothetical protein
MKKVLLSWADWGRRKHPDIYVVQGGFWGHQNIRGCFGELLELCFAQFFPKTDIRDKISILLDML